MTNFNLEQSARELTEALPSEARQKTSGALVPGSELLLLLLLLLVMGGKLRVQTLFAQCLGPVFATDLRLDGRRIGRRHVNGHQ